MHLSGLCWLFLPIPPHYCPHPKANLWVPLGFCSQLRVVWKELQVAWPWHREEARQRGEQITELARTAGNKEEPWVPRVCMNPDQSSPSTAGLGSFEQQKHA